MKTGLLATLQALERKLDREAEGLRGRSTSSPEEREKRRLATAYLRLAKRMTDEGHVEEGLATCRKAVQVNPDDVDAHYYLAFRLERMNCVEEARTVLSAFEDVHGPAYVGCKQAFILKARLEYRQRNLEASRRILETFIDDNPDSPHRAEAYVELGKTLDSLGQYDSAMTAFTACNNECARSRRGTYWIRKSAHALESVETSVRWYGDRRSFGWRDTAIRDGLSTPVLIVGFPRSGTTLLDQILDSHPALTTLEEKATLTGIADRFYGSEAKLRALWQLGEDGIAGCRQLYWSNIAKYRVEPLDGSTVVDKHPLKIRHLDIFARLFPDVKIIAALRDPRDAVLSNYMQMYALNAEMATSLDLARCAAFYSKVMELYLLLRQCLPHNIHEVRYEALVHDLEGESTRLLRFLGLEWDDNLLQYHLNAKKRVIKTPSYDQATKPIYRDSVGKWKHYERHLRAIAPVLQPFVDVFGYAAQS